MWGTGPSFGLLIRWEVRVCHILHLSIYLNCYLNLNVHGYANVFWRGNYFVLANVLPFSVLVVVLYFVSEVPYNAANVAGPFLQLNLRAQSRTIIVPLLLWNNKFFFYPKLPISTTELDFGNRLLGLFQHALQLLNALLHPGTSHFWRKMFSFLKTLGGYVGVTIASKHCNLFVKAWFYLLCIHFVGFNDFSWQVFCFSFGIIYYSFEPIMWCTQVKLSGHHSSFVVEGLPRPTSGDMDTPSWGLKEQILARTGCRLWLQPHLILYWTRSCGEVNRSEWSTNFG